jgi:hypothetical protein
MTLAAYEFNCTFTAGHPETAGANRSEPERAASVALTRGDVLEVRLAAATDPVGLERQRRTRQFMRTLPHVQVMTLLKPNMGPTRFVTRTISAADGRPGTGGALEDLASG